MVPFSHGVCRDHRSGPSGLPWHEDTSSQELGPIPGQSQGAFLTIWKSLGSRVSHDAACAWSLQGGLPLLETQTAAGEFLFPTLHFPYLWRGLGCDMRRCSWEHACLGLSQGILGLTLCCAGSEAPIQQEKQDRWALCLPPPALVGFSRSPCSSGREQAELMGLWQSCWPAVPSQWDAGLAPSIGLRLHLPQL
jgi:hypothetical protein